MRTLNRNKQIIYIANKLKGTNDYGTPNYDVPFLFKENLSPVDGDSEIKEYGDRISKMYKSIVPLYKWKGKIKEGDVAYLEGSTPKSELLNGNDSNYNVVSVRYSLNVMIIYFEKSI